MSKTLAIAPETITRVAHRLPVAKPAPEALARHDVRSEFLADVVGRSEASVEARIAARREAEEKAQREREARQAEAEERERRRAEAAERARLLAEARAERGLPAVFD